MQNRSDDTWNGNTECDFCHNECEKELIDGNTTFGVWAVMCPSCFQKYGRGYGIGVGSKYRKIKGKLKKVLG